MLAWDGSEEDAGGITEFTLVIPAIPGISILSMCRQVYEEPRPFLIPLRQAIELAPSRVIVNAFVWTGQVFRDFMTYATSSIETPDSRLNIEESGEIASFMAKCQHQKKTNSASALYAHLEIAIKSPFLVGSSPKCLLEYLLLEDYVFMPSLEELGPYDVTEEEWKEHWEEGEKTTK
ncbi:hypothetical protein P154DRAFT_579975 [Amniculicola lignicola CBS 123094]|uniref:Uncharacterized protein n=1 Tax=Amniculicola lignicola CBS 123094 TaxID=1392246 RepID=A0A6A5W3J6_9PLEO|nr:hypothetical protein P154DRAFT_579975 [Amniculicola lignicola CBS 123094]